ncbi:MAG: o-succinylbenzoate synthase [Chloroflexi bacterium]|nr:o-succinylbenzoate synthase [Chloroflexota bacterium]|tara:strand:+ start:256 stop:1353 length:1098 start_codon:yes stop_codon:yes gene_type:complete
MKFDELRIHHVAMPLIDPWITSYGSDYEIHSVLINVKSGNYSAWAETCALELPTYSYESVNSIFYNISEIFAPSLLGKKLETSEELINQLSIYKGNPFAKAGLDIAWWNLKSKISNTPLHILLGGKKRKVVAGADFGVEKDIDTLLEKISVAIENGAPRIKLKVKRGWDLDVLGAVTKSFPEVIFHIDCNGGYTLEDINFFKSIDKFQLAFIEQPLSYDDLFDHSKLAQSISTPLCLDESINSIERARQAIDLNACKYINIKPGRVGGLTNSIEINRLAENAGIPVWVGGMLESALGASVCIALATLSNFTYPGDLFPSDRFYKNDLCKPENKFDSPYIFKPLDKLPIPDKDLLNKYTIKSEHIV